ncbi:MAG: TolC family outer membrane protein [Proteobacteria bacterium]|jgi:outer membrane protein|nr:TolC family outer membrane protein [Pseudomonadota bacterium]
MPNKYNVVLISCLLAVWILPTQAQEGPSVGLSSDLAEILDDARNNDPTYQATQLRLEADLEALPEARSFLFPQLSANIAGNEINESFSAPEVPFVTQGDARYSGHSYGLQLRQVLFNPALFSQVKRARLEVEIAQAGLEIASQDLLLRAAQGYFEVLLASDSLDLASANLESSEEQYRQIESRFEVGLATRAEHQQALARWQTAIANEIIARNNMRNIERFLETITGTRYSNLADLPADTDVSIILADIDRVAWIQLIEQNNLSLYQQQLRLEVAGRSVDIEKAGHYPTLEAVVNHGTRVNDGSIPGPGSRGQSTDASLQLSIPIFSGGRVRSRVRSANYEFEAARQDLSNVRSEINRQGEALLDQLSSQKQTVEALAKAVEANELALEAKQEGFAAGIETNLNVLDAQRDLFQTSLDYSRARYNTLILRLQLEQAAGNLSDTHLGQLNALLVTGSN